MPDAQTAAVIVATQQTGWASILDSAAFWPRFDAAGADPDVLILVDMGATAPRAASVEALIDALLGHGPARIRVATGADSSSLLAANRDVYALADISGYRYRTDAGHDYDIVDLAEEQRSDVFPPRSTLQGTPASAAWMDADFRIVLGQASLDGLEGYAGALDALIAALPMVDKDLHYRLRRDAGEVVTAILAATPPEFALVEWADEQGEHGFRIATSSPLLADTIAVLKLGLDPFDLPMPRQVAAAFPLPPRYAVEGDLSPVAADAKPTRLARRGRNAQARNEMLARLMRGWAQPLDAETFPFFRAIDAQAARWLGGGKPDAGVEPLLATAMGMAAAATDAWQSLFAKDMLIRRTVTLDLDPAAIPREDYDRMVAELDSLTPIATAAPERAEGLRWRKWDRAVLFSFERTIAVPFDHFVASVDVSRAISFMNDYLGGVIVACAHDEQGRPVRQAERNLYLPQPNYMALYGGKPIDVSKIEVARYGADEHRLYWKTLHSANDSAEADDGIVVFARSGTATRVTIIGKQLFTLPPVWRVVDLSLFPAIEEPLTTMAYHAFFDRTLNNFEALVEGRDVRIGTDPAIDKAHPSVTIEATVTRLAERAIPLLDRFKPKVAPMQADADGFVHVTAGA